MTPRWPPALAIVALAGALLTQPARADAPIHACLPPELEPILRDALALELGAPIEACETAEDAAALRIVIERVSPVAPLDIEVAEGERRTAGRTAQPFDVMGPHAIAVVVHGLIDELRAPPSASNAAIAEARSTAASATLAPTDSLALPEADERPARPRRLILGVLGGLGLVVGLGDVTRDGATLALSLAVDGRLHDPSGHGGAITARLAPMENTAAFLVDVRYSFRLGYPPGVDVLTGAMFVEVGLGVIRALDNGASMGSRGSVVDRIGVGPSLALVGVIHFGPFTLGLDSTVIASVSPWGTRLYYGGVPGPTATLAIDLDFGIRVGSHLPL